MFLIFVASRVGHFQRRAVQIGVIPVNIAERLSPACSNTASGFHGLAGS
ncbi:TPA: hypothetical protein SMF87_000959 [Serratia marcescens]|nr:hypothetical protein [Serratia marcescens]HEJ7279607.1 hypothetical protein [Serratia marcescens]